MNPLDGLYHYTLGFPQGMLDQVCKPFYLRYSNHAREALRDDRYLSAAVEDGRVTNPRLIALDLMFDHITIKSEQVIELEVLAGQPVKVVVRRPATEHFDIVLVILVNTSIIGATVKSFWLNERSDQHVTLRQAAYRKP